MPSIRAKINDTKGNHSPIIIIRAATENTIITTRLSLIFSINDVLLVLFSIAYLNISTPSLISTQFKHPKKSWSDGMNFTDTMQQLFDGRFNQFQNGVMEDIRMIVDNQKYFAENLARHVNAIEELTKMAKDVQDYLKAEPLNTKKDLNWVEIKDGVEILR